MRIKVFIKKFLRKTNKPPAEVKRGYNIYVWGYIYRFETSWKRANKITRSLQRKGVDAEFRRLHPANV